MKVGDLVRYVGPKHHAINQTNGVAVVIVTNRIMDNLERRRVMFHNGFHCVIRIDNLELVSESR